MLEEIIVTALDINKTHPLFADYAQLTPVEKIDRIVQYIDNICQQLQKNFPTSPWIIAWREHGITGSGIGRNSAIECLSVAAKDYLHKKMTEVRNKYPKLTIIAGTVPVSRSLAHTERKLPTVEEKTAKLQGYYDDLKQIGEEESKLRVDSIFFQEQKKLSLLVNEGTQFIKSNTVYIYCHKSSEQKDNDSKHETTIIKHRKSSPAHIETRTNEFFRPGSSKTYNPQIKIPIPDSKDVITAALTVCYEQFTFRPGKQKNLFHFVLSDTIPLDVNKFDGTYVIHLDSYQKPKIIVTQEDISQVPKIQFFEVNLLEEFKLEARPIAPFFPLELKVMNQVKDLEIEYKTTIAHLKGIKQSFENAKNEKNPNALNELKANLQLVPDFKPQELFLHYQNKLVTNPGKSIEDVLTEMEQDYKKILQVKNEFKKSRNLSPWSIKTILKNYEPSSVYKFFGYQYGYFSLWAEKTLKMIDDHMADPMWQDVNSHKKAPTKPSLSL